MPRVAPFDNPLAPDDLLDDVPFWDNMILLLPPFWIVLGVKLYLLFLRRYVTRPENEHHLSKKMYFLTLIKKGIISLGYKISDLYKWSFTETPEDKVSEKWKKRGVATVLSLGLYALFKTAQLALRYERHGSYPHVLESQNRNVDLSESNRDKWLSRAVLLMATGGLYAYFLAARYVYVRQESGPKNLKYHLCATLITCGIYPFYKLAQSLLKEERHPAKSFPEKTRSKASFSGPQDEITEKRKLLDISSQPRNYGAITPYWLSHRSKTLSTPSTPVLVEAPRLYPAQRKARFF